MVSYIKGENMKALIYANKEKDLKGDLTQNLVNFLIKYGYEYCVIHDENLSESVKADVLFVLGGDGTILALINFANNNHIPIVGINVGRLGFLTEFELYDMENAIKSVKNGDLVVDKRTTLAVQYNGKTYYALNDVAVQRFVGERSTRIANLSVYIDDAKAGKYIGDGVLINTATGSTAYSFSAGGPILVPGTNAFSITPIAAHSFNNVPLIYSSSSICELQLENQTEAGIYVDGTFVSLLGMGEKITVKMADTPTIFLRKKDYNFYSILFDKFKENK